MRIWRLAWRGLPREWRGGELRVLSLALLVAVAAVSAVGFFTDRVARAMNRQAAEMLAADLVVASGHGIREEWVRQAESSGLRHARTTAFRSMLLGDEGMQLVEVKAASGTYPLRGELKVSERPYGPEREVDGPPAPGTAWVDPRLFQALGLAPGDTVQLGDARLEVTRVLSYEPDRAGQLFTLGPRVLMHQEDVARTGLVRTGSLVNHRLLLSGPEADIARYRAWVGKRLAPGERVQGVQDARPELRTALDRAGRFLGLAALVSVLLAGVAVAMVARQYAARHLDSAAVMRCLGAGQRLIMGAYLLRLTIVGVAVAASGVAVGYGAQAVLASLLGHLFVQELPPTGWLPALQGAATGLVALLGFAVPPLFALGRVPPLRVLRRESPPADAGGRLVYTGATVALVLLVSWYAGDWQLAATVMGGALGTLLVLAGSARLLVAMVGSARQGSAAAWRFGIANIARRPATSVVQVVAFGIGLMALLLLALVRGDLLAQWQGRLPPDAPNRFLIDIQPDQVAPLEAFFRERGIASPEFHPMIKGRLVAIDGSEVSSESYESPRAQRLVDREFNLSFARSLAGDNRVVAGRFWRDGEGPNQWSVEEGIAETLGIRLGSTLRFRVGTRTVEGEVTSLRAVDWDSFRVNFFVLAPPALLEERPGTFITSFHLPPARSDLLDALVRAFPNVTVIDVEAVMSRVRTIMERVSTAVEFVFGFTLAAGLIVLLAAIQSTRDERAREAAVLRALGASRRQLMAASVAEFTLLGALAGTLAALAATALGYGLAAYLFELPLRVNGWLWLWAIAGGTLGVGLAGSLGVRRIVSTPPMRVLQQV